LSWRTALVLCGLAVLAGCAQPPAAVPVPPVVAGAQSAAMPLLQLAPAALGRTLALQQQLSLLQRNAGLLVHSDMVKPVDPAVVSATHLLQHVDDLAALRRTRIAREAIKGAMKEPERGPERPARSCPPTPNGHNTRKIASLGLPRRPLDS